jgi:hypothetical protein
VDAPRDLGLDWVTVEIRKCDRPIGASLTRPGCQRPFFDGALDMGASCLKVKELEMIRGGSRAKAVACRLASPAGDGRSGRGRLRIGGARRDRPRRFSARRTPKGRPRGRAVRRDARAATCPSATPSKSASRLHRPRNSSISQRRATSPKRRIFTSGGERIKWLSDS